MKLSGFYACSNFLEYILNVIIDLREQYAFRTACNAGIKSYVSAVTSHYLYDTRPLMRRTCISDARDSVQHDIDGRVKTDRIVSI